jgi:hypothetical protein
VGDDRHHAARADLHRAAQPEDSVVGGAVSLTSGAEKRVVNEPKMVHANS